VFRRQFLDGLTALNEAGRLAFLGELTPVADKRAFEATLPLLRRSESVVYAKRPFAGPQAVFAYLDRYTHRVAISNSRLVRLDKEGVTFNWKDYRINGRDRRMTMTLDAGEFIRRFLLRALPSGFHRIRHYGCSAQSEPATSSAPVNCFPPLSSRPRARVEPADDAETPSPARRKPVLRRPDDHRRDVRRREPCAIPIAKPD
jgi:hypothetical protein